MLLGAKVIPIVNHKYKYIVLYSAKAGCTSLRSLYLSIHDDELSSAQREKLDWYHNINEIHPLDAGRDYSDYYVYCITRNPYSRVVSAFLDQYVFARNANVQSMMSELNGASEPVNFIEFLEFLSSVPDERRDSHFQTQAYFPAFDMIVTSKMSIRYRLTGQKPDHALGVNLVGDIAKFNHFSRKAFNKIFAQDKAKKKFAINELENIQRKNSSFYSTSDYTDASTLNVEDLNNMVYSPKPQDFYNNARAIELVDQIYQQDFYLFGYDNGVIPQKGASSEASLVPDDFDWQMYLRLNPDLPHSGIDNERAVVRHFLEFGRHEATPRAYKIEAPDGFDWRRYLELNNDLVDEGIDTELAAIEHYISFGIRQDRLIS